MIAAMALFAVPDRAGLNLHGHFLSPTMA